MSTNLRKIQGGNGAEESEVYVTVFCGHSRLLKTEPTRRCIQITVKKGTDVAYAHLTDSGIKALQKQLKAVMNENYEKFAN